MICSTQSRYILKKKYNVMRAGASNDLHSWKKRKGNFFFRVAIVLVIITAFICSRYLVQFMIIQGSSMEPTFHNNQLVLLKKIPQKYEPGDVIAFYCDGLNATLVKRIVATPGDTVQIVNGTLLVNGIVSVVFPENGKFSDAGILSQPILLKEHEYVVIGDNIEQSKDSRNELVGPVVEQSILGVVIERKS